MPFYQPTGVSIVSRNVALIENALNSQNSITPAKKPEPEKCCKVRNNWVKSYDESMFIFTKTWVPIGAIPTQTVVVFVHDITEHCERYLSLFTYFASKGIEVQAFDLPGFGETGARIDSLGITGGYDTLIKEIDNAVDRACSSHPSKPVFLMGHGMGGALVLNYVCGLGKRTASLAGIIPSSPYIKPTMAGAGSRFPATYNRLAKWYPHISVQFPVAPQELTRDRAEQERYLADGLIRGSVSLQCLGDMIYQGQKVLTRRWKYFPGPLPTLLLHGTDDPICSYQATALLSSQLLKRNPSNFIFRSWKCNRHDPHWDIDALSVRSEFIQWIRGHCKHFVSLPLEPGMVRYDSLKSIRSNKSANAKSKDKGTKTKEKQSKSKVKDKGKKPAKETTPPPPANESQSGDKSPTKAKSAATLEPEAIQDLEGLRREQLLRMQKAEEKRREYSQGALESAEGANNTSTTNIQQQPPPPQTIHNKSLGVSLDELTLRLEKEVESGATIPRAISLDQIPRPIDMALSTISLPLALGGIVLDVVTPILASPKVGDKEINESGGSTRALPQASIQDTAKVGDEPVTLSSIESLAKREATGDIDAQAQPVITVNDPVVQDVAPTVEQTEQPAVHVEAAKDASPVLETTLSIARTPLEEVEEVVPAMESTPHMGHPPPEQSMIAA